MIEFRVREPDIACAVQGDAVQLQLHVVVAVARHVEHHVVGFVDFDNGVRFKSGVRRDGIEELAGAIVEIVVLPAVPFGFPDEALAILQPAGSVGRRIDTGVQPTCRPFFVKQGAALAGLGIAICKFDDLLPAIRPLDQQAAAAVRSPLDAVNIVADDGVIKRFAISCIDERRFIAREVVDQDVRDWIRRAGLRIRFDVDRVLHGRLVHLHEEILHRTFIEPVERNLCAVWRPPDRRGLRQFFAVDPAGRAVLDASLFTAVRRNLPLA